MAKNLLILPLFLLIVASLHAQDPTYHYRLGWDAPHTYTYTVHLEVSPQQAAYTDFQLPAWRPGRYYLQDYAAGISHFVAQNDQNKALKWKKLDKNTWRVFHHEDQPKTVNIHYHFFADNQDAGSSYLGENQVYFNPINLLMYVPGRLDAPAILDVPQLSDDWKVASALKRETSQRFTAPSYHDLVDCPTVFAPEMKQLSFTDQGTTIWLHFQGNYRGDESVDKTLIDNVRKICRTQAAIFGGYPFEDYHFIYRLVPFELRHAVEHSHSSCFVLPDRISSSPHAIASLYGITAHEFWHVWNVKRIRPAALLPYDYSGPQYTGLHWFTEGVTDYYTHLTLVRAGIISLENFYLRLSNSINAVENDYAAMVVSPTASSMNSWTANSPYANPMTQVSYYGLGARIGLLLDLSLRKRSDGKVGLDDLFCYLYQQHYQQNKGVGEDDIQRAAEALTRADWSDFFDRYIHGTKPFAYEPLFKAFGIEAEKSLETSGTRQLGLMKLREISQGVQIIDVRPEGDAWKAGIGMGVVLLSIDDQKPTADFKTLKKGDQVEVKYLTMLGPKSVQIRYSGKFSPYSIDLKSLPKPKTSQQSLLEGWIGKK